MVKNNFKERSDRRRQRVDHRRVEALTARKLPHDLEAEAHVISWALQDEAGWLGRCLLAGVTADSFYEPRHGALWAQMAAMAEAKLPVDTVTLAHAWRAAGKLATEEEVAFFSRVTGAAHATSAQAEHFLEIVLVQAELRAVIREASSTAEACYNHKEGALGADEAITGPLDRLQGQRVKAMRDLPPIVSGAEFAAKVLPEPPQLVEGVMHLGRRTLIAAPSKGHKTWVAIDLSISIAHGLPLWGMRTHQARVLHVDLELPEWGLKSRAQAICEARGVKMPENVDWWSLDGYQRDIDELMPTLTARAPLGKYGMIVLEPAYVLLGRRDENDNGDVTDFMNRLSWLTRLTGAAVVCAHHYAKGDAAVKDVKDRASGAGAWIRAPDTLLTLTQLKEEEDAEGDAPRPERFRVDFVLRNLRRHKEIGVEWHHPVMRVKDGLDLNAYREVGRPKVTTSENIMAVLPAEGLTTGQWQKKLRVDQPGGLARSTFNRRRDEAEELGLVKEVGVLWVPVK